MTPNLALSALFATTYAFLRGLGMNTGILNNRCENIGLPKCGNRSCLETRRIHPRMPHLLLVIDDHEAARLGLSIVLQSKDHIVAETTGCPIEAIKLLKKHPFAAIILDIRLMDDSGLDLLAKIREWNSEVPVLVLSSYDNPTYIARAAALGANDYIFKSSGGTGIREALLRVMNGVNPPRNSSFSLIRERMRSEIAPPAETFQWPLTNREYQVLYHIALGLSNKEIARSLGISVETVKEHVQNVLRKISANDRTEAAVKAVRAGFID